MTDFAVLHKSALPPLSPRIGDTCSYCDRKAIGVVMEVDIRGIEVLDRIYYCAEHEDAAKSWKLTKSLH